MGTHTGIPTIATVLENWVVKAICLIGTVLQMFESTYVPNKEWQLFFTKINLIKLFCKRKDFAVGEN